MPTATELGRIHVEAARGAAEKAGIAEEALASALLTAVIELMQRTRPSADVASQLRFEAEQVEDAEDFPFMRP